VLRDLRHRPEALPWRIPGQLPGHPRARVRRRGDRAGSRSAGHQGRRPRCQRSERIVRQVRMVPRRAVDDVSVTGGLRRPPRRWLRRIRAHRRGRRLQGGGRPHRRGRQLRGAGRLRRSRRRQRCLPRGGGRRHRGRGAYGTAPDPTRRRQSHPQAHRCRAQERSRGNRPQGRRGRRDRPHLLRRDPGRQGRDRRLGRGSRRRRRRNPESPRGFTAHGQELGPRRHLRPPAPGRYGLLRALRHPHPPHHPGPGSTPIPPGGRWTASPRARSRSTTWSPRACRSRRRSRDWN